jgi:hypothetical protein
MRSIVHAADGRPSGSSLQAVEQVNGAQAVEQVNGAQAVEQEDWVTSCRAGGLDHKLSSRRIGSQAVEQEDWITSRRAGCELNERNVRICYYFIVLIINQAKIFTR